MFRSGWRRVQTGSLQDEHRIMTSAAVLILGLSSHPEQIDPTGNTAADLVDHFHLLTKSTTYNGTSYDRKRQ